jgi:chromosomal replication initiator protein
MSTSPWLRVAERLREQLSPEDFATWIKPLKLVSAQGAEILLQAPNGHFLHTLEESFGAALAAAAATATGGPYVVRFSFLEESDAAEQPTPLPGGRLNPGYSFETFVVGASNQFAHAAARAVAESPSHSYNPLFLYGGVGLGKTHLLHAIGHRIQSRNPRLRVVYVPTEQFLNELINSIRYERMPSFRERYRSMDVLLVDDVQLLANKERTQEEFFHTFNALYTNQKQIILTSDSPPRNIPTLEERLRSRFEWGLIADLQPPDLETKVAILRRHADLKAVSLPDDVGLFIARQVKSNIRELEGLLTRVLAFSSLTGKPLSLDLAHETLKDILPEVTRKTPGPEIIKFVARHYGLKVSEIKSRNNTKQIAFPRQVAMYLCKRIADLSFPEIGKLFNDKHHSTVMYSVEKIEDLRASDSDLDRTLETLTRHFS